LEEKSGRHTKTVIILLGPTGVGKTGFSVHIAKALHTEIISADSMQIYQHMNIGTSTPSQKTLKEVKHHLINILSPDEYFSAGKFKKKALEIIGELHERNKIPLVVGGTGLYIKTLTQGLCEGPEADWTLREALKQKERDFGAGYLYQYLKKIDSEAAKRINPNDTRRIIRAIEISRWGKGTASEIQQVSTKPENYHFIKIGLFRERKELNALIEQRVDSMIKKGLLQEAERLFKMNPHRTPLQALGYKEMHRYLDGLISFEDAVALLKKRTKMYAKRQLTWFKKEPGVQWIDITGLLGDDEVFIRIVNSVEIMRHLLYGK
jgi:tRNA dimethylallyltransferase